MHNFEWENKGVHWKYFGMISGKEIIEATRVIYGDSRFDDIQYKLVDFLDSESIHMNADEVAEIACQHLAAAKSNPNVKTAILIKKPDIGIAESFAAFFKDSSWEVRIFQDRVEADKWTGRKIAC